MEARESAPLGLLMTPRMPFMLPGDVTAVIKVSACGILQTAQEHSREIGKVYAGRNGTIGAFAEDLSDTSVGSDDAIVALN
jgi:6-phosphofructokinase 1